jgi:transposase-like protein
MPEKDILPMRTSELKKLEIIKQIEDGRIRQKTGASLLGLTTRQMRRLQWKVRENGAQGIIHGNRGRRSKKKTKESLKEKILNLRREKYTDFKPTFMSEKLKEEEGVVVSKETLRKILIAAGEWQVKVKHKKHCRWRERKESFGEMLQLDGSHHDWLEGRGPRMVLMKFVDDATSRAFGRFYEYEGTLPAMDLMRRYIKKHGIPRQIYADKHTTYKTFREATTEEMLNGEEPKSEFKRVVEELGTLLINANSPQAKGRIERNFATDQDRLVKEMRLAGICTMEEANNFLGVYWAKHNRKFAVRPAQDNDIHIAIPERLNLWKLFRARTLRIVRNDNTIQNDGLLYQLNESRDLSGKKAFIEIDLKGRRYITYNGAELDFTKIDSAKIRKPEIRKTKIRKKWIPPKKHPWRNGFMPEMVSNL